MKRYSVAEARTRMAELLDEAERGAQVVIDRRGAQFAIVARSPKRRASRRNLIAAVDHAVVDGRWSWGWGEGRLRFRTRGSRQR